MMQINEETPNDVNGSPINRRASSGNQVNPIIGGRVPDGRQQATGPDVCEGQAHSANHNTTVHPSQNGRATGDTERRHQRRKWTKDENKEIWRCYILSDPATRNYRKRMHNIWNERENPPQTEQRLADQIRAIKKNNWISKTEIEEMSREVTPQEEVGPEAQNEPHEEGELHIRQAEEDSNLTGTTIQDLTPDQIGKIEKIKQWMQPDIDKMRILSLKAYNQKKLKEKTREVDELLSKITTNNITETNNLVYAGARLVMELMEAQAPSRPQSGHRPRQPPWKRRLNKQIMDMRADLSRMREMKENNLRSSKARNDLEQKYKIQEKGLNNVMEDVKQRLKAKAHKVQRYENRNKGYQQNKLFETNQKCLYNQLRGETNQQDIPEAEPCKRLWENIWSNPVTHNGQAEWLQEIKTEERDRVKQGFLEITTNTVKNQLKKVPNWKAPGPDEVHGYWLKNFKSLHSRIAQQLQQCINNQQAPKWMTTGRTTLIQKDKSKGNAASNYRPITCLPMMWKLLTGIIYERLYTYLEETNTIPHEQKGCRRKCRGTKDQLLIDKLVMKNSKRRKTNLSMAWIDYKKAFDMIPHSWLIECLQIYGAEENTIKFLKNTMPNWKTVLTAAGNTLAEVNIKRGIFQGDSLSPLLFVVAMIPITKVLQKMKIGYQLEKGGSRINHLMFMDDIKLFGRSVNEIDSLIQTVRVLSGDIRMEFGIEKCALVNTVRGKVTRSEGIQLPDGSSIKDIDEAGYKYLGVIEGDTIKHQEMKDKIKKEYISRIRAVLKSKLNSGNIVKAINTWAVPVIRYSAGIVDWKKLELQNMDRKTRKTMNMYQALHPRANVARLYLPRKEGGKGLLSAEECVNIESRALGQYLKTNQDEWLKSAWNEKLIKDDEDPETYKERRTRGRQEEWHTKTMHGQFIRQTSDIASEGTWQWLERGELKKETEGMIMAAQDQALRTRYIQNKIDGVNVSPKCRKCNIKDETINHIASECSALAQNQYKKRHDTVAKALHWSMCKKYNLPSNNKWYEHLPEKVVENEEAKLLWDYSIQTDRVIQARRPDLTLVDKNKKSVSLIDVSVPWDSRVEEKEREKVHKYQDLRFELRRLWEMPVEVVPIVIGALGTIPKNLKRNLEKLEAKIAPGLMQKSVMLETAHIIRRVMDA